VVEGLEEIYVTLILEKCRWAGKSSRHESLRFLTDFVSLTLCGGYLHNAWRSFLSFSFSCLSLVGTQFSSGADTTNLRKGPCGACMYLWGEVLRTPCKDMARARQKCYWTEACSLSCWRSLCMSCNPSLRKLNFCRCFPFHGEACTSQS
jgi:hypothetical protein